ncbi:MAG: hypothetical protein KH420_08285 [Clostridiales bacterium]|nr:hypothetical protein [Clostridiales bacterium]
MEHAHDFLQIVNGTAWANGAHPPDFAVQLQERTMRCRLSFDENIAPPQGAARASGCGTILSRSLIFYEKRGVTICH